MKIKGIRNMREKLNITAKKLGIKEPGNMNITELLDTIYRYRARHDSYRIRRKFGRLGLTKHVKRKNLTEKDLNEATHLNQLSISDLKKIVKLQGIKNLIELTREDLIYILLRSEKNKQLLKVHK